ncbi:WYL domain-containing protein [Neolewinella aurantiaca]|uniref:WYL domain-containing protein n=1 Tax=Neolewinella aurantiaca TaxID=2602767 RepID=A0A5C7FTW1_9BACT|nr:WYL domain-containing protein [Neolewinella aurantiaca]TXF89710.1 WYL domain-containing protein [Neolewinella aurantiaca]
MPANKNALLRYRTIDKCLQNHGRKWTLNDLIEACSDALYEYEGKDTYVSKRTVQHDIQLLRSDKLGYNAPIEVYDKKYYRYSEPDFSITDVPLTEGDLDVLSESVAVLRQFKDFSLFSELNGVIQKLEDKIYHATGTEPPVIHLDKNEQLKGLEHLDLLYQAISKRIVLRIGYQSFSARQSNEFLFHPYLLKEFNNRWFLVGRREGHTPILTLALDRMISIAADLKTEYIRKDFDADTFYKDTYGVTVLGVPPIEVRLWVNRQNAPYVLTKPFHSSQRLIERRKTGGVEIAFTVHHNFELERLLLGFGSSIEVLAPKVLRRKMKKILRDALHHYEK